MKTREHYRRNIAHRIRQEHRKHKKMGDLEWSNIAATKIITMLEEFAQQSAQERYKKAIKFINIYSWASTLLAKEAAFIASGLIKKE